MPEIGPMLSTWGRGAESYSSERSSDTATTGLFCIFPLAVPLVSSCKAISLFCDRTHSLSMTYSATTGRGLLSSSPMGIFSSFLYPGTSPWVVTRALQSHPPSLVLLGLEVWRTLMHINRHLRPFN